jgi:hypothetical protein
MHVFQVNYVQPYFLLLKKILELISRHDSVTINYGDKIHFKICFLISRLPSRPLARLAVEATHVKMERTLRHCFPKITHHHASNASVYLVTLENSVKTWLDHVVVTTMAVEFQENTRFSTITWFFSMSSVILI